MNEKYTQFSEEQRINICESFNEGTELEDCVNSLIHSHRCLLDIGYDEFAKKVLCTAEEIVYNYLIECDWYELKDINERCTIHFLKLTHNDIDNFIKILEGQDSYTI